MRSTKMSDPNYIYFCTVWYEFVTKNVVQSTVAINRLEIVQGDPPSGASDSPSSCGIGMSWYAGFVVPLLNTFTNFGNKYFTFNLLKLTIYFKI